MEHGDDDRLADERADTAFKRLIEGEATVQPSVPAADLVTRTLRRLPTVPPAVAAQQQQRRSQINRQVRVVLLALIALVAGFNIWGVAAHGPQLAFMVGDGESGLSAVLLGLQLAAKPFWYTIRAFNPLLIGGAFALAIASIWLIRRLVRRAQAQYEVETP